MKLLKALFSALFDPDLMPTALRVALVVGSILFAINHGSALVQRNMTRERWISGVLTYLVPDVVNIQGHSRNSTISLRNINTHYSQLSYYAASSAISSEATCDSE